MTMAPARPSRASTKKKRPAKGKGRAAAPKAGSSARPTAETLAGEQREISVSEFFAKNRHLLGFDNPRKALLTTVKEAVDNAMDACEEAGILPDLFREGQGIVAEGMLTETRTLNADTVLAKHDENYMPREVADAPKEQGVWQGEEN